MQIKILMQRLWNISHRSSSNETKIELKRKLDFFASGRLKVSDFQNALQVGPQRTIEIGKDHVYISLSSTNSKYLWTTSDPRTATACLVVTGEYEPLETEILKFFASGAKLVADIGANVGYYAVELGKALSEDGRLLAFEPIPDSFEQLSENVRLNALEKNVACLQLAISNQEGQLTLFTPKISGSSATSARNLHPEEDFTKQEVSVRTLDLVFESLMIEECDLIKVDVEGAELMVIQGALQTIEKYKPVIFAELLRKWSAQFDYAPDDVLSILLPLGYKCFAVSENFPEISRIDAETVETNFVFVPENKLASFQYFLRSNHGV